MEYYDLFISIFRRMHFSMRLIDCLIDKININNQWQIRLDVRIGSKEREEMVS